MDNKYWPIYDAVIKELGELLTEAEGLATRLDETESRIAEAKKGALALGPLCGEKPWEKHPDLFPEMAMLSTWGITALTRAILSKPPADWMSPVAVRDQLKQHPEYKGKTKNLLPSVHTVLRRLVDSGEVEPQNRDGRTWYRWREDAEESRKKTLGRKLSESIAANARTKRGLRNVRVGGK